MSDIGRRLLRRYIELSGRSLASVAERLGHDRTWLTKILNGHRQIKLDHVEAVLGVLDISISEFLVDLACEMESAPDPNLVTGQKPRLLLKALLQTGEDQDKPIPTLERWRSKRGSPSRADDVFEIDRRVGEIDNLREHDANAALVEAELWLDEIHGRYATRRLGASESVRVATALGVWASALRVRGRVRTAARVMIEAFAFHGLATSSPTYADLLERAAFIAKDFGFLAPATDLVQKAHSIFAVSGSEDREIRSLLALGILYLYLGQFDLSEAAFKRCIGHSSTAPIQRAGAAINLVSIYEKQSRFGEADSTLALVKTSMGDLPATWKAAILSACSRSLERCGDLENARQLLEEAIQAARGRTPVCPQFLRFFALADLLVRMGRHRDLITHAVEHSKLLGELEDTPTARRIVLDFFHTIRTGVEQITQQEISMTVERFQRAVGCRDRS